MPTSPSWPPLAGDPIGHLLQTLAILTRALEHRLGADLGLNLTDLAALEQLVTHGPLTPGDLAARLQVTTPAGTQIVDRLERAGHIRRERQAADRRKVLVIPAPASVARLHDELASLLAGLDAVVADLTPDRRAVIETFLGRIVGVYRAVLDPKLP
jgi:DNA-binding MarR family transcriptional regulator